MSRVDQCPASPAEAAAARPRITMRYDRARIQLDRHVNYVLAARVAGAI